MTSFLDIEQAAHESAYGLNSLPEPTPAMQDAGNYKKGRPRVKGIPLAIENPRGSLRKWRAADGTSGANLMKFHYGYVEGVIGADGDELDVFIGPVPETNRAYVINQYLNGSFDEHKVMLGFPDQRMAEAGYLSNFNAGWTGLDSCVPCSIDQLKWWMANGDMSKPLTPDQLPYEGRNDMEKVLWDSAHQPRDISLAQLLYNIRAHDGRDQLMFEPVTVADIHEDADAVLALDALVIPYAKIEPRMAILQKVMDRAVDGLSVAAMQVTEPFTQKGTTNVAVVFELSDGQTLSIFFHNPDVTPKKIMPGDDLISWKWMLNKKDVTIAVAPERGRDLNVRTVAMRVMMLAAKNSARFVQANSKRAERMQTIDTLKQEFAQKESTLEALTTEITQLEAVVAARPQPVAAPSAAPEAAPIVEPVAAVVPQPQPVVEPSAVAVEPQAPAYASVLEAAGFTNPSGNEWAKSVERADATLRLNIRVFGEPQQFRLVRSATFPNGITGTPSAEVGTYASVDEVVAAAQAQADEFAAQTPAVSTVLSDEEQAALSARLDVLEPQIEALTDSQLAMMAANAPLNIGGYDKLVTGQDTTGYLRDSLIQKILSNHPDDIEAALNRWRDISAPAAPAAEPGAVPDITYRAVDDMFTAFYPNTPAGEEAWKKIAEQTEGTGKVLNQHVESTIQQLRDAGYTVAEATEQVGGPTDDELAAALATPEQPHKSQLVLDALKALGWSASDAPLTVQKNVGGGVPGDLNEGGDRIVSAQFDDAARYLALVSGFDTVFDVDTRDGDAAEIAQAFDARTMEWAASTAFKPEPTPAAPEPDNTPTVPDSVRKNVEYALSTLRNVAEGVDAAKSLEQRIGGNGRYQADALQNRQKDIDRARGILADFRELAPQNGIDPEAFIASLGGEPDLTPSPEALEWMKPAEPVEPAPVEPVAPALVLTEPESPTLNEDTKFLRSIIDGTRDLTDASIPGDLKFMYEQRKADPEFVALFKQAATAYKTFALAKARTVIEQTA